jgi:anti-sigma B factor antagonist
MHFSASLAWREESMEIQIRKAGNATILDLNGPLRLGDSEQMFRDQIQKLIDAGSPHVAINLASVNELDSSGIGALVRAFSSIKRAGGKCTYYSPTQRVRMLLKMVRLDSVLDIVDDEAAALARV